MQTLTSARIGARTRVRTAPLYIDVGTLPPPTGSKALDAILQRERTRADRLKSPLAILVLAPENPANSSEFREVMDEATAARIRITDDAFWAPNDRLFVILPHTTTAGAWIVSRDLVARARLQKLRINLETFYYPNEVADDGDADENGRHDRRSNHSNRRNGEMSNAAAEEVPGAQDFELLAPRFVRRMPPWKRAMDIVGSLVGFVLAAPIMLAAAIAVRLTSPGPILFSQVRIGAGGTPFTMYKFRTMVINAEQMEAQLRHQSEQDGPAFKMTNDPRVTKIGRFLRSTSIDELPQLWNVLRGNMSIVGPRPLPVHQMDACDQWHRRHFDVTPGLTCTWQASARSAVTFDEWARMDTRYCRECSFWGDIAIILKTIPAVLVRRGAK